VYEPFGLAPLDAALCGCAILANDLLSLREVWGDAALYFHDASSLKSLLCALVACPEMLARASLSAFRRGQELTASRMADAYSELYANLMHAPRYRSEMELTTHAR
jgi:hypothetical protein